MSEEAADHAADPMPKVEEDEAVEHVQEDDVPVDLAVPQVEEVETDPTAVQVPTTPGPAIQLVGAVDDTPKPEASFLSPDVSMMTTPGSMLTPGIGLTPGGAGEKRKRQCRFPGCTKTIKSQGHCQKHGARAKRCKVSGCEKQAQGTHQGMCKRHWKEKHVPPAEPKPEDVAPEPSGESVYDVIIPASVAWKATKKRVEDREVMPLVQHLRDGADQKPSGWHRADERKARGVRPIQSLSVQFEPWERQLVMFEILCISGTMWNSHKDLAHAWGREKGFHNILTGQVCERHGELERKKRSDVGKLYSTEEREAFKTKLKKAKSVNGTESPSDDSSAFMSPQVEQGMSKAMQIMQEAQENEAAAAVAAMMTQEVPVPMDEVGVGGTDESYVAPIPPEPASIEEMVTESAPQEESVSVSV
eukprot:scaffold8178_cov49-Attheya_sp.AAC.3